MPTPTNERGQDIRPADDGSLRELFKYFTKLFKKKPDGTWEKPEPSRLNVIFLAISGKRIFQPFGGLEQPEKWLQTDIVDTDTPTQAHSVFDWVGTDWMDTETSELLSGYSPSPELIELLSH